MSVFCFHNPGSIAFDYYFGITFGCFLTLPKCDALVFEVIFVYTTVHGHFARTNYSRYIFVSDRWCFHNCGNICSEWLFSR